MYLIDTNIITSDLLLEYEKDNLTRVYNDFYRQIPLAKRIIPSFILTELETLMTQVMPAKYRMAPENRSESRKATINYIDDLIENATIISPDISIVREAFSIFENNALKNFISLTDSMLIAIAAKYGFVIVSRDKKLCSTASSLNISCYDPASWET